MKNPEKNPGFDIQPAFSVKESNVSPLPMQRYTRMRAAQGHKA